MIRRTISEWGRISYGNDCNTIPELYGDRIARAARASWLSGQRGEGVLQHGRAWLQARGIVGVISSLNCQLEILPKIDHDYENGDTEKHRLARNQLVHMLSRVYNLDVDGGVVAKLGTQSDTLLDILVRIFCKKVFYAVCRGIPRLYIENEDNFPSLRGRLDVMRQFSVNIASPQKLACKFDALSFDISLNQIVRATILKLLRLSRSVDNRKILRQLEVIYSDISDVPTRELRWDLVTFDRSNQRWKEIISFARLFLLNIYQDTSSGQSNGYALLFNMSALFEEYVSRLSAQALSGTEFSVISQGGNRACLYWKDSKSHNTRPDLIIRRSGSTVLIVDTKWKLIGSNEYNAASEIDQKDVYQMMAYQQVYECQNTILLYPSCNNGLSEICKRRYSVSKPNSLNKIIVSVFDISDSFSSQMQYLRDLVRGESVSG